MLYIVLRKVIHWTIQAALILRLLLDTLIEWVFKLNEYDKCIANKIIKGKKCNVIWHVDDLEISMIDKICHGGHHQHVE